MTTHQQAHVSVWFTGQERAAAPGGAGPLEADAACEVCIVGAGIAGILAAERLASAGLSIIIIDAGPIAGGETGRTTAHISNALDDRYEHLAKIHGARGAALAAASHTAAINRIEQVASRFDCDFKRLDGYLAVNARHHNAQDLVARELHAAREAGVQVDAVDGPPQPWPQGGPMLRFPSQAQVHPLKLLYPLVRELEGKGVRFHTHTRAVKIDGGKPGADARVETEHGQTIRCKHIIIATNTPFNDRVTIHTKQMGFQTYAIAAHIPRGHLPPLLFWDGLWESDTSYHYVRLFEGGSQSGDDLLIVGGEDHKTGQGPAGEHGEKPFRCLEEWTRKLFPFAGEIEQRWSGEVMEPADAMGFIGRNPGDRDNIYIITGDSGHGWTHAGIASILIPDLIAGRENIWETLYDPARKSGLYAAREYARENANTFLQYADWLRGGDVSDESKIAPGEGAIIREGLKYLAVYKDESGRCTRRSAVCPHLGGIVRWNKQEKTWDCPCHSSRFDRHGKVMHGPANSDLKPMETGGRAPGRDARAGSAAAPASQRSQGEHAARPD